MTKEIIGFINKNNDIFNIKEDSSASKYCCKVGQGHENKIAAFTEDGDLKDSGKTIDDLVTKIQPSTNGNFASVDENGNLQDSGYEPLDFAESDHEHNYISDFSGYEHCGASISVGEGDQGAGVISMLVKGDGGGGTASKTVKIDYYGADNLLRALQDPDDTPKQGSNHLITSGGVYSYMPSCIGDVAEGQQHAKVYADNRSQGDPNVIIELNDSNFTENSVTKYATIGIDNIDNLNRALLSPDSEPTFDSDRLITSDAVYTALQGKANITNQASGGRTATFEVDATSKAATLELNDGTTDKSAEINMNNIDNLNRALNTPDSTPDGTSAGANKLITSKAVYEALAEKMNVLKEVELRFDSQVGYYTMHANADDIIPFISAEDPQLVVVKCSIETNANNIVHVRAIGSLNIYHTEQYDWEIELRVGETLFGRSFTARNTQEAEEAIDSMFDDYGAGAQVSKMNVTLFPSVS